MIMTIVPGSVTVAAGTATCASTLATATAVPARQAGPARRPRPTGRRRARRRWRMSRRILVSMTSREPRIERREVGRVREPVALRPHRLVAGRAGVPRLDAGEPPDDPVGRLDQPVGGRVDLRRLVEDLERLREEPLRRDLPAVPVQPRLARRARDRVDPVGLGLGGVVLPELHPGVRVRPEGRQLAQRRAVGRRRQHRAGREVDPDPDDVGGVDAGGREHRRDGRLEDAQVVVGVLEGPVGRQDDPLVGGRQVLVDDAVAVRLDGGRELRPSATSTSTARPDSVPKSTPIAYRLTVAPLDSRQALPRPGDPRLAERDACRSMRRSVIVPANVHDAATVASGWPRGKPPHAG